MRRLVSAALLVGLGIALSSQGCDFSVTSSADKGSDCSAVTYDLRQPPSRAEVGMASGASYTAKSCDDGFPASFTLAQGAGTSLTATLVTADSYSTPEPATAQPTTMDVHTGALNLDGAMGLARRLADDLGIDPGPLQTWRQQVAASDSTDGIDTPFMRSHLGYVTVEMQVSYLGTSSNTYVHLIFNLD